MQNFELFSTTGKIIAIDELFVGKTGFKKRTFTISDGNEKKINLDLHYWKTKELDGKKVGDWVNVEFVIKGHILNDGRKINNLIAQKVTPLN